MSAVVNLPDAMSGICTARRVLDGEMVDLELAEAACDVLDPSEWYQDRIRIRRARAWIGAVRLAARPPETHQPPEVLQVEYDGRPQRSDVAIRMEHHLAQLRPYRRPSWFRRACRAAGNTVWLVIRPALRMKPAGYALVGAVIAIAAHVAIAAPGKVARTGAIFDQIEVLE